MRWGIVGRAVAAVTLILGVAMAVPFALSVWLGEGDRLSLGLSVALTVIPAAAGLLVLRRAQGDVRRREALLVVTLSWCSASFFGALPFYLLAHTGDAPAFRTLTDSIFEAVSGFTTTGASVVARVEALPRGTLLWRAETQWLGGMGIIVLMVAVLPMLGIAARELFQAEVPGPTKDKLTPHLRDTARQLWIAYVALTFAEVIALVVAGMGWFDSICHTFTTMATGGFSTRDAGIMAYDSPAIEAVLIFFMAAAGLNFALHVRLLGKREWRPLVRDPEARAYVAILLALSLLVAVATWGGGVYASPIPAVRHATFQVVSLMTTTGFASADFDAWTASAPLAPVLLIVAMFIGGCSGSTAGAIKVSRILVAAKHALRELTRMAHPRAVVPVRIGGTVVPEPVVATVCGFVILYVTSYALGVALVAMTGEDLVTSASAVAATLGNVGPGLGAVGPTRCYGEIHPFAIWVLTFEMLVGRLELLTVLALATPAFWRR